MQVQSAHPVQQEHHIEQSCAPDSEGMLRKEPHHHPHYCCCSRIHEEHQGKHALHQHVVHKHTLWRLAIPAANKIHCQVAAALLTCMHGMPSAHLSTHNAFLSSLTAGCRPVYRLLVTDEVAERLSWSVYRQLCMTSCTTNYQDLACYDYLIQYRMTALLLPRALQSSWCTVLSLALLLLM